MQSNLRALGALILVATSLGWASVASAQVATSQSVRACYRPSYGPSFLFGKGPREAFANVLLAPEQKWQEKSWSRTLSQAAKDGYRYLSPSYGAEAPSELKIFIKDRSMLTVDSAEFKQTLENEKASLMALYRISNRDYNRLAAMAFGILGRETEFGTNFMYYLKERFQMGVTLKKAYDDRTLSPEKNSRGLTQIKTIPKKIADFYCIRSPKELRKPRIAAVATLGFLAESLMYMKHRAQKKALEYVNESNVFDYTLYVYFGSIGKLVNPIFDAQGCALNKVATPEHNLYLLEVKDTLKGLVFLERPRSPKSNGQNNACRLKAS